MREEHHSGAIVGFPSCRHIKTDGVKCESPAMSGRHFCYYHTLYRHRNKPNRKTTRALNVAVVDGEDKWHRVEAIEPFAKRYTLGPLEDAPSIQVAISTVLNALADQRIDYHRASTLLYGLQLAANNLRHLNPTASTALAATPTAPTSIPAAPATTPTPPEEPATAATATVSAAPTTTPDPTSVHSEQPATPSTAGTYAQVPPQEELSSPSAVQPQENEELAKTRGGGQPTAATNRKALTR